MKKIKFFFLMVSGIFWEWIAIPILFYFIFRNRKIGEDLFPSNRFFLFSTFAIYFVSGMSLTILSFLSLHKKGKGTIMPLIPTKKLVNENVYFYCRNPMYLGYSFLYFAFSFLLKNIWFSFISIGIFLFIFVLAKIFEEKKLYERFGNEYLQYKKSTPFIFPVKVLFSYEKSCIYWLFCIFFILSILIFIFNIYLLISLFT